VITPKKRLVLKIHKTLVITFTLGFISAWISVFIVGIVLTKNSSTIIRERELINKIQAFERQLAEKNKQISELQDQIFRSQSTIQNLEEKTNRYEASSAKCHKNSRTEPQLGQLIHDQLNIATFELKDFQGFTYDLYRLEWSEDCNKFAFLIELPGTEGGAYTYEKYKPRGLYVYDDKSKKISTAKRFSSKSYIRPYDYYSNYWTSFGTYVFEEVIERSKSEYLGIKYEYDPQKDKLRLNIQ